MAVEVVIAGALVTPIVRRDSLRITDVLNEQPNTAVLTLNQTPHRLASAPFAASAFDGGAFNDDPVPVQLVTVQAGQDIKVFEGGFDAAFLVFGGEIVTFQQVYEGQDPAIVAYHLTCTDYTRALTRRKISKSYGTQSATAIVLDLIAQVPGFTTAGVAANLPAVAIDFTFEDMNRALTRLASRIGGYWYVDYSKDIHFFLTEPVDAPATLQVSSGFTAAFDADAFATSAAGATRFADVQVETDLTQVRTRVLVEGMGSQTLAAVTPGEPMIPIRDPIPFLSGGGVCVSGPQRITYGAVTTPVSVGSLVGPGASPSAAPTLAAASGAGVETGAHSYAITYLTASGESLPGPWRTITAGTVADPGQQGSPPLTAGAPTAGGAVTAGTHDYTVTFVTASGETVGGYVSAPVTTGEPVPGAVVPPPTSAPTISGTVGSLPAGAYQIGDNITVRMVYLNAFGKTTPGPVSNTYVLQAVYPGDPVYGWQTFRYKLENLPVSADPTVTKKRAYHYRNGVCIGFTEYLPGATLDGQASYINTTETTPPITNTTATATKNTIPLTNISISSSPTVTGRRIYRRFNQAGWWYLVDTIPNNTTTTYTDTKANSALGPATNPMVNTATANQVQLTAIPTGGVGVTGRRLYRTAANQSALKLLTTIADTTTTTYLDSTADAALGASPPAVDTSGLQQPSGQINSGATSILVAGTDNFSSSGGWAVLGNGAVAIRYTGKTATALTGIPASGPGSLRAPVNYNTTITVSPTLTGIPTSGAGAILYPIGEGQDVNLLVIRDDVIAQTDMSLVEGGDGVIEHYIQDRRVSAETAGQTALAELKLFKSPERRVRYTTRDPKTRSGKTIQIALGPPTNLVGAFLIQRVELSRFADGNLPALRSVEASSTRFSFEDVLRRLELEVYA